MRIFRSLRSRLQLWYGALLVIVVAFLLLRSYGEKKANMIREFDLRVTGAQVQALPALGEKQRELGIPAPVLSRPEGEWNRVPPGRGRKPGAGTGEESSSEPGDRPRPRERKDGGDGKAFRGSLEKLIDEGYGFILYDPEGKPLWQGGLHETAPPLRELPRRGQSVVLELGETFRGFVLPGPARTFLTIGRGTGELYHALHAYGWWLLALGVLVVAAAWGGGFLLTGYLLRPLEQISEASKQIALGEQEAITLPPRASREVAQLASALNHSYSQMNRLLQAQIQFSADASHELRTPVAVIVSQAELALQGEATADGNRRGFEIILQAAERLRIQIASLLELARYKLGQFECTLRPTDLSAMVEGCLDWLGRLAEQRGIRLSSSVQSVVIQADGRRLEQVLINLVANAIKQTPHGGSIRIASEVSADAVVVKVSDTGPGIPEEKQAHLFDRFYRSEPTEEDDPDSSGLGLAISRAIIKAHGGEIGVTSRLGEGATFWFTLRRGMEKNVSG